MAEFVFSSKETDFTDKMTSVEIRGNKIYQKNTYVKQLSNKQQLDYIIEYLVNNGYHMDKFYNNEMVMKNNLTNISYTFDLNDLTILKFEETYKGSIEDAY